MQPVTNQQKAPQRFLPILVVRYVAIVVDTGQREQTSASIRALQEWQFQGTLEERDQIGQSLVILPKVKTEAHMLKQQPKATSPHQAGRGAS